jgi:hypothetical protein
MRRRPGRVSTAPGSQAASRHPDHRQPRQTCAVRARRGSRRHRGRVDRDPGELGGRGSHVVVVGRVGRGCSAKLVAARAYFTSCITWFATPPTAGRHVLRSAGVRTAGIAACGPIDPRRGHGQHARPFLPTLGSAVRLVIAHFVRRRRRRCPRRRRPAAMTRLAAPRPFARHRPEVAETAWAASGEQSPAAPTDSPRTVGDCSR